MISFVSVLQSPPEVSPGRPRECHCVAGQVRAPRRQSGGALQRQQFRFADQALRRSGAPAVARNRRPGHDGPITFRDLSDKAQRAPEGATPSGDSPSAVVISHPFGSGPGSVTPRKSQQTYPRSWTVGADLPSPLPVSPATRSGGAGRTGPAAQLSSDGGFTEGAMTQVHPGAGRAVTSSAPTRRLAGCRDCGRIRPHGGHRGGAARSCCRPSCPNRSVRVAWCSSVEMSHGRCDPVRGGG